ncbi:MAG: hypothetical protein ABSF27_03620 [Candidatus Dormibacteria bacterium]
MAAISSLALVLASLLGGCGTHRLGGLEVRSSVIATESTASTNSVPQGTDVQVRITVTNLGTNSISGVTARAAVPAGFTYLETVNTATNGNSERTADIAPSTRQATLTWGAWTMGPGASGSSSQVLITAELEATGAPATAEFSPQVFAAGYVNTLSGTPLSLAVTAAPQLKLQLEVSPAVVVAGDLLTYQLVVTNTGTGAAPDTSMGVTLPDDFDYGGAITTSGNAGTDGATFPTLGTEVPVWTGFDLPGASSAGPGLVSLSFSVTVLATVPDGSYDCSASLVASTGSQTQDYLQQNYAGLATVEVSGS